MIKRIAGIVTMVVLSGALTSALAEDKTPDATIKLTGGSVAAGIGVSWGDGTLSYKGKDYPIDVKGLSVGDVGITKLAASGKVYGLKDIKDFSGNYTAVGTAAAVAGGGGITTMRNQSGVTIDLMSTTQGVKIAIGGAGVEMKIKE